MHEGKTTPEPAESYEQLIFQEMKGIVDLAKLKGKPAIATDHIGYKDTQQYTFSKLVDQPNFDQLMDPDVRYFDEIVVNVARSFDDPRKLVYQIQKRTSDLTAGNAHQMTVVRTATFWLTENPDKSLTGIDAIVFERQDNAKASHAAEDNFRRMRVPLLVLAKNTNLSLMYAFLLSAKQKLVSLTETQT